MRRTGLPAIGVTLAVLLLGCTSTSSQPDEEPPADSPSAVAPPDSEIRDGAQALAAEPPSPQSLTPLSKQQATDLLLPDQLIDDSFPAVTMVVSAVNATSPATYVTSPVVRPNDCQPLADGIHAEVKEDANGPMTWVVNATWQSEELDESLLSLPKIELTQEIAIFPSDNLASTHFEGMVNALEACSSYAVTMSSTDDQIVTFDWNLLRLNHQTNTIEAVEEGVAVMATRLIDNKIVSFILYGRTAGDERLSNLTSLIETTQARFT